jgi:hypothetical protein
MHLCILTSTIPLGEVLCRLVRSNDVSRLRPCAAEPERASMKGNRWRERAEGEQNWQAGGSG